MSGDRFWRAWSRCFIFRKFVPLELVGASKASNSFSGSPCSGLGSHEGLLAADPVGLSVLLAR